MYFIVIAKCGHVGRNYFIRKSFPVVANSGEEAANKVRSFPRVKHDMRNAILSVIETSSEEFEECRIINSNDAYFRCNSIQEQRTWCPEIFELREREDTKRATQRDSFLDVDIKKKPNGKKHKIYKEYINSQLKEFTSSSDIDEYDYDEDFY